MAIENLVNPGARIPEIILSDIKNDAKSFDRSAQSVITAALQYFYALKKSERGIAIKKQPELKKGNRLK